MTLVEIARFMDLEEAQVAAAALRSSGMTVVIQNEGAAHANFALIYAMGGVRLLADESDAAIARAFIAESRVKPSGGAETPPTAGDVFLRLVGAAVTLLTGVLTPLRGRRRLPF